jgi:hypothetical protein
MKRLLPGAWLAAFCGLFSIFLLAGCPGSLEPGVGVGLGGMGGSGGGSNGCEVPILTNCGGCHIAGNGSAGLDLMSAGVGARLVGAPSSTNTSLGAMCMGKTLLVAGSNPAAGLFIDKITNMQDCGSAMPIGPALENAQLDCLKTWALSVTSPNAAFSGDEATP